MESRSTEEDSIRDEQNIYVISNSNNDSVASAASAAPPPPYTTTDDERARLLDPSKKSHVPCWKKHRNCLTILFSICLIFLINALVFYFVYFRNCIAIKVMALNVWGMPYAYGGLDKEERIAHIAQIINGSDFDVILLEELWMEPDYTTIRNVVDLYRPDYYMTDFRQLGLSICDGRATPFMCSGLSLISRYPFVNYEFNAYTDHGKAGEMFIDGEYLARKGVGRVRLHPPGSDATLDVFITHTIADAARDNYSNKDDRIKQVTELMDSYILKSDADVVILGGDFNTPPDNSKDTEPYAIIRKYMKNSIEEIYYKLEAWLNPQYATYGNQVNNWSNKYDPVTYDYIFHRTNGNLTVAWTNIFNLPFYHFYHNGTKYSVSDHEAITATIYYKKWKTTFPYI